MNTSQQEIEQDSDKNLVWDVLSEPAPMVNDDGTKFWYNKDGELHRDNDRPAIEYISGSKSWYKNGEWHRDNDKPAIVWVDAKDQWYTNGKLQSRYFIIRWIKRYLND